MGQLTSLRHLILRGCDNLTSMPLDMSKLTNLKVLPWFVVGKEKRVSTTVERCMGELKDLKPLTNLKGHIKILIGKNYMNDDGEGGYLESMSHLSKVEINFVDGGCLECEGVMEKLEPHSNLKVFSLWSYEGTIIPRWGRAEDNWALSLPYLVEIKLTDCNNLEQIPSLSKLHNLKSLTLDSLHKLEYMENTSSNSGKDGEDLSSFFPSLESLHIVDLRSLKGWWKEELVEDDGDRILMSSFTFPRLSKLAILKCPKLTSFPSCPSLETLDLNELGCFGNSQGKVRLSELVIDDMGLLKTIPSQCFTSLYVTCNKKAESLSEFGDVFWKCTSSLISLEISDCPNLRRLGRGGLEHLTALEELKLRDNDQLSFSEDEVDDDNMPWKSLSQSLRSLNFDRLDNMKSLPKGMQYLTSLQSLTFFDCEITALPEWISCLSSLQYLSIRCCSAIKSSLPESMRNLTSLQKLVINWCPYLEDSCKKPNGKDWPKIQHIPHIDITLN